jgi:hypothetical protein
MATVAGSIVLGEVESNQIKTKPLQSDYTGSDASVELLTCSSISGSRAAAPADHHDGPRTVAHPRGLLIAAAALAPKHRATAPKHRATAPKKGAGEA